MIRVKFELSVFAPEPKDVSYPYDDDDFVELIEGIRAVLEDSVTQSGVELIECHWDAYN
jgi:hypothetical protein